VPVEPLPGGVPYWLVGSGGTDQKGTGLGGPDLDGRPFAGQAPTLASALSTSSFNFGTASGSWIAGIALESSFGRDQSVVGTVIAAFYFIPLGILVAK
jgi:hypothetical protein